MKRKNIRIACALIAILMSLFVFSACEEKPPYDDFVRDDRVIVYIKQEYKDAFLTNSFTIDDFDWSNIEKISYGDWYDNFIPEQGYIVVYLKRRGKLEVRFAINRFIQLDFVSSAELYVIQIAQ